MKKVSVFEWTYNPKSFFESEYVLHEKEYILRISEGVVSAKILLDDIEDPRKMSKDIEGKVTDIFNARQIINRNKYKLTGGSLCEYRENGSRGVTVFAEGAIMYVSSSGADFVIADAKGNILQDSKAERIKSDKLFIDSVAVGLKVDPLVKTLVESFHNAVENPENELIYLYEILDAISNKYGGKTKAIKTINISKKKWDYIGKLSNIVPVKQSRHRGRHNNIRPATKEELFTARETAREIIELFIKAVST